MTDEESDDYPAGATKLARSLTAIQRVASSTDATKMAKAAPQMVSRTKSCP